jgi:(2Fe-2S) ferredoxin
VLEEDVRVARHVFVCVNRRPEGSRPACGTRGGQELADALRHEVAARPELWGRAAVTACECLGPCFDGPNVVIYPDGVWYAGVRAEDAGEIADSHLAGGCVVERLRYVADDDD